MKVIILVLSMKDGDIYDKFYKTQKDTWDSVHVDDVETYYFFGNQSENKIIGCEIHTTTPEGLYNCGHKTIQALELIKNKEYDFIFRTNSSSYVDKKLLKDYINDKPKTKFYSGIIGEYGGVQYGSGCGYFLSKDLVELIIDNKTSWDHTVIDDISTSKLLGTFGVKVQNSKRFDVISYDNVDLNHFHYRLKTNYRELDIQNMIRIFNDKNK